MNESIQQPIPSIREIHKSEQIRDSDMKEDWVECTLGEICFTTSGGTPRRSNKSYFEGEIPWVKSGELDKGIIYDSEEHISEDAIKNSSAKLFPKGTLLFALYGATIGKMAILGIEAATNQAICGIFKSEVVKTSFLFNYLLLKKNQLIGQGIGGAQPNISQTILKQLEIPLPPLPIQRAIVAKIEELFSSLDSGMADLKKAQDQLVIYRQAVLKKAFEGDYKKVALEKVSEKVTKVKRKEMDIEKPLLYLDIGGIDNKTNVILSHKEFTWGNAPSRAQQIVKVGDVLFSTVRTYLKNIAQITNPIYNDEVASSGFTVIRGKRDLLNPKFIFFITTSQFFLEPLNKLQRGTSYPAVRDKDVFSQKIPLPTLEEQHQIVREIESRLSVCDKVEESLTESLEKAQALRQSILKKAFEGKLLSVAEIERCKQEKDYEPASVLLERIKAEKK